MDNFIKGTRTLRKKCPYSELFWSVFPLTVFSLNAAKYGPELFRIPTLFTQ